MNLLILGRGKTGSLVAEVARARGHAVTVLGRSDNPGASALTQTTVAGNDAILDFTAPDAVVDNVRACFEWGGRVVVGTTGWYDHLPSLAARARESGGSLLYGTNFSVGVQAFFRAARALAESLPAYAFSIEEAHHVAKKDIPSGTALTLQSHVAGALRAGAQVPIVSRREGDLAGLHVLEARSANDRMTLRHEACSRAGFAEGAVSAAEWLAGQEKPGVWDFAEIADRLAGSR